MRQQSFPPIIRGAADVWAKVWIAQRRIDRTAQRIGPTATDGAVIGVQRIVLPLRAILGGHDNRTGGAW